MTAHRAAQSPTRQALATPEDLAEYLRTTTQRLANDRYHGTGPKFIKYGRTIRYRWADVHSWEEANSHTRTSR
ncbi:DNA-binding protein [Nocardia colli]|uniref:DNA-binding protein n=1 Tax=Nocardia colli TaxID=2545717 RepID=A0A5N0EPF9_9NOCA|nr:DNA-binding protein [Nocardia colli]